MKIDVVKNRIVFTLTKYEDLQKKQQEIEKEMCTLEDELASLINEEEVETLLEEQIRRHRE